eukprot:PhM_4_TR9661/c0_g1_i3/m.41674
MSNMKCRGKKEDGTPCDCELTQTWFAQAKLFTCGTAGCNHRVDYHPRKRGRDDIVGGVVDGMYNAIATATPTAISVPATDPTLPPYTGKSKMLISTCSVGWPSDITQTHCFVREDHVSIVNAFLHQVDNNVVIIGEPGVGKSFAGGYAVYRCLAAGYDVIYAIRESIYVFNRTAQTATHYLRDERTYMSLVYNNPNSVLVHDCQIGKPDPPTCKRTRTIVISSPNEQQFKEWKKQTGATDMFVDVWSDDEIEDACAVLALDFPTVMQRRSELGPIPRHIFSKINADNRKVAVLKALAHLQHVDDVLAFLLSAPSTSEDHPSHKLMMMTKSESTYTYVPCNNKLLIQLYLIHGKVVRWANDG